MLSSGHLLCLGASAYSETFDAGVAISSITSSGTLATVTTGSAHGLSTNDYVSLSASNNNGLFRYLSNYSNKYEDFTTYTLAAATTSPASVAGSYQSINYSVGSFDPMLIRWADVNADIGPKPEVWKPELLLTTAGFLFALNQGSENYYWG